MSWTDLRRLNVKTIDLDEARRHFDLPVDDQFASRADLVAGLRATRDALLDLLSDSPVIPVWRGMEVDHGWVESLAPGSELGRSWAWSRDGAAKGSGLDHGAPDGVMLAGAVGPSQVDWALTVAVNTFHEDECEIVLKEDAPVLLLRAEGWPAGVLRDFGEGIEASSGARHRGQGEAPPPGITP